jgi:hypothetical protein
MKIKLQLDDLFGLEFIRLETGEWSISGANEGTEVQLVATDEQVGAMLFLCAAGNPKDTKLDEALYALLTKAQATSGIVP